MTRTEISCSDDIIDVRDVIARYEELEVEIEAQEISEDNGAEPQLDDEGKVKEDISTCGECGKSWNDALMTERTPAPSARCPYEGIHEEIEEFNKLKSLLGDLCGDGGDEQWKGDWYPVTMIRDSYFETYAQELADDIGAIDAKQTWPNNCIDWEQAARELQQDYSTVDFDGVEYWYR